MLYNNISLKIRKLCLWILKKFVKAKDSIFPLLYCSVLFGKLLEQRIKILILMVSQFEMKNNQRNNKQ